MINTGINIGIDGTGAISGARVVTRSLKDIEDQAKNTVSQVDRIKTMISGFASSAVGMVAAIVGVTTAVYGMREAIRFAFKSVDEFKLNIASISAVVLTFMDKSKFTNIGDAWKVANEYAKQLVPTLELISARMLLTGEQATLMFTELAKGGIFLDATNKQAVEGFEALGNAIAVLTRGQDPMRQIMTEIRAVITGQAQAGSMLMRMLTAIDPLVESHMKKWRDSKTTLQEMGKMLFGFKEATQDLAGLWRAVSTTISTLVTQALRYGLLLAYTDIMTAMQKVKTYLVEHRAEISDRVAAAYASLKAVISATTDVISKGITIVRTFSDELKTLALMLGTVYVLNILAASSALTTLVTALGSVSFVVTNLGFLLKYFAIATLPSLITPIGLFAASLGAIYYIFNKLSAPIDAAKEEVKSFTYEMQQSDKATLAAAKTILEYELAMVRIDKAAAGATMTPQSRKEFETKPNFMVAFFEDQKKFKAAVIEEEVLVKKYGVVIDLMKKKNAEVPDPAKLAPEEDKSIGARLQLLETKMRNELAVIKRYMDLELKEYEFQYDEGLISFSNYYNNRLRIIKDGTDAELQTIMMQIEQAEIAKKKILPSDEADKKKLQIDTKIAELRGKADILSIDRMQKIQDLDQESVKVVRDRENGYKDLMAQVLEFDGRYTDAADTWYEIELRSPEMQRLWTEAAEGTAGAVEALAAKYRLLDIEKDKVSQRRIDEQMKAEMSMAQESAELQLQSKLDLYAEQEKMYSDLHSHLLMTDNEYYAQLIQLNLLETENKKETLRQQFELFKAERMAEIAAGSRSAEDKRKLNNEILAEEQRYLGQVAKLNRDSASEVANINREESSKVIEIWQGAVENFGDAVYESLTGQFEDATDAIEKMFKDLIKELIYYALINPIKIQLMQEVTGALGIGGVGGVGGSAGGAGGIGGSIQQGLNIGAGNMGFFGGSSSAAYTGYGPGTEATGWEMFSAGGKGSSSFGIGPTAGSWQSVMGYVGAAYGIYNMYKQIESGDLKTGSGALQGAVIGTAIAPGIGTIIGGIWGAIAGFASDMFKEDPKMRFDYWQTQPKTPKEGPLKPYEYYLSQQENFKPGFSAFTVGDKEGKLGPARTAIMELFNATRDVLLDMAEEAGADTTKFFKNWSSGLKEVTSPEGIAKMLKSYVKFLTDIDVSKFKQDGEKLADTVIRVLAAWEQMGTMAEGIDSLIEAIKTGSDETFDFAKQLMGMDDNIASLKDQLTELKGKDPSQVLDVANELMDAIIDRYTTEIQYVENLAAAVKNLKDAIIDLQLGMARGLIDIDMKLKRFPDAVKGIERVFFSLADIVNDVNVPNEAKVDYINTMLGLVDEWVSVQTDAIKVSYESIMDSNEQQIDILEKQKDVLSSWNKLLNSVKDTISELTLGLSNPQDVLERLDIAEADAAAAKARYLSESDPTKRAEYGETYHQALKDYLSLAQEAGDVMAEYQRPGEEYQAIFDYVLNELRMLESDATRMGGSNEAMNEIDRQIAFYESENVRLTGEMNAKIAGIEATAAEAYLWLRDSWVAVYEGKIGEVTTQLASTEQLLRDKIGELSVGEYIEGLKGAMVTELEFVRTSLLSALPAALSTPITSSIPENQSTSSLNKFIGHIFANGAYVQSPTVAMIGEAGNEWAIPDNKMSDLLPYLNQKYSGDQGETVVNINIAPNISINAPDMEIGMSAAKESENVLIASLRAGKARVLVTEIAESVKRR